MFKRHIIAVAAVLVAGAVLAQAYRWVDEDGVVHFSDRPIPGAEQIELPAQRTSSGPRTPTPSSSFTRRNEPEPEPEETEYQYESLSVASPASEETLWNIEGVLNVQLALSPRLERGHRIRVYFNGEPQMVSGTSFQLTEVYRGEHNLQAEVIDRRGQLMIRSEPSRFFVQQTSIQRARPN